MKKIHIIKLILLLVLVGSCSKDDLLDIRPKGESQVEDLVNQTGIDLLLTGAYAVVDGVNGKNGEGWAGADSNWVWGGVASDNAYKGTVAGDQAPINAIEGFYVDAANVYVANHWAPMYDGVLRTNDILRILPDVEDMDEQEKAQVEGQAKFLRAHYYVELTRVHGPVPYIDENTENPSVVPNDHLVWPEIEADLQFAADNLPGSWEDKGRATSWAAKTYLAYVYMFQRRFDDALPILRDIYNNGPFELMESYEQNYRIAHLNNKESIFEIQYAVNDGFNGSPNAGIGNSIIGMTFMGGSGFFQPSHNLVTAYRVDENGLPLLDDTFSEDDIFPYDQDGESVLYEGPVDPRLDHTIGRPGVPFLDWGIQEGHSWIRDPINGGPYINKKPMFLKSERGTMSSNTGRTFPNANNYRKFKLSHVMLWLAEAEVEATGGSLETATNLINELRNRAKNSNVVRFDDGTPAANYSVEPYPVTFPNKEYALKAIRHENRIELAMEGYRFYELVRWGMAGEVMNNYLDVSCSVMSYLCGKSFTEGQHEIWPIPQRQRDLSKDESGASVLVQNPGY